MPVWSSHIVKKYWAMRLEKLKSAGKFVGAFTLLALLLTGCKTASYSKGDYSYRPHFYSDTRLPHGYRPFYGHRSYYRHH